MTRERTYPCAHHDCGHVATTVTDHMIHASTAHTEATRRVERPVSCWACAAYLTVVDGIADPCSCGFVHPGWIPTEVR